MLVTNNLHAGILRQLVLGLAGQETILLEKQNRMAILTGRDLLARDLRPLPSSANNL
jgi:hypothetical protein